MVNIASIIDHTLLKPNATYKDFKLLCEQAVEKRFCSVCVPPFMVGSCKQAVIDTDVKVCTVIGFPLGYNSYISKLIETKEAIKSGADEIDVVINVGDVKDGRDDEIAYELIRLREVSDGRIMKVIIECCLLNDDEKLRLCRLVSEAGADFIKTSTGFSTGGATVEDVRLLHDHVKPGVLVKAAGGISTFEEAAAMISAGASRIGASRLVRLMEEANVV